MDDNSHIQVALRVHPLVPGEIERGEKEAVLVFPASEASQYAVVGDAQRSKGGSGFVARVLTKPKTTVLSKKKAEMEKLVKNFEFDICIGPAANQRDVWKMTNLQGICDDALSGKATTVMCFGQTGSGKTFTMSGFTLPENTNSGNADEGEAEETPVLVSEDGLQYQAVKYIAERMAAAAAGPVPPVTVAAASSAAAAPSTSATKKAKKGKGKPTAAAGDTPSPPPPPPQTKLTVRASYLELYNEQIRDLLSGEEELKCRWSAAARCFFVQDLLLVECTSLEDFLLVLREGQANRHRAAHRLNEDSSRSHALFTVYIDAATPGEPTRHGKLTFVDLAGSERLRDTGSSGEDTKSINKSLFALGNVIEKLSARGGASDGAVPSSAAPAFIPYRSSVLTQLLMDSLDGAARTLMVACVTPSERFAEESLRTMHYAQRTRSIATAPAERVDLAEREQHETRALLRRLRAENELFRRCLGLTGAAAITEEDIRRALLGLARASGGGGGGGREARAAAAAGGGRGPRSRAAAPQQQPQRQASPQSAPNTAPTAAAGAASTHKNKTRLSKVLSGSLKEAEQPDCRNNFFAEDESDGDGGNDDDSSNNNDHCYPQQQQYTPNRRLTAPQGSETAHQQKQQQQQPKQLQRASLHAQSPVMTKNALAFLNQLPDTAAALL